MQGFLPELVFHQDEPIADPVCVPLYYVSKLARDSGTIVVQVGEGADEIFSGYDNYVRISRFTKTSGDMRNGCRDRLRRCVSSICPGLERPARNAQAVELIRRLGADEPLVLGRRGGVRRDV